MSYEEVIKQTLAVLINMRAIAIFPIALIFFLSKVQFIPIKPLFPLLIFNPEYAQSHF